jgi:hypothetical protein
VGVAGLVGLEEPPPQAVATAARRIRKGVLGDIRTRQNSTGLDTGAEGGLYCRTLPFPGALYLLPAEKYG